MTGSVILIWDYDGAVGQVNATYPYKFDEEKLIQEIRNVDAILALGKKYEITMTFACLGFAAEAGHYPYHVPEQIRKIFDHGHEIASHSWKHEWFPYLEREQIVRSLSRSKMILEQAIGVPGAVAGFVPPFSRPMTWYAKGAFSLGDRVFGPWYPGGNLESLIKLAKDSGYKWFRVTYRPLLQKILRKQPHHPLLKSWESHHEVVCVPLHVIGFEDEAHQLLEKVRHSGGTVVVCGHPSGLTRPREENIDKLDAFMKKVADYQNEGSLKSITVSQNIAGK